jgi:hypothetical protein
MVLIVRYLRDKLALRFAFVFDIVDDMPVVIESNKDVIDQSAFLLCLATNLNIAQIDETFRLVNCAIPLLISSTLHCAINFKFVMM